MKQHHIKYIAPLHHEWLRGLEFYTLELHILQERLEQIASGNTGRETAEGIEHFQNQVLIQREYMAGLKQRLHKNLEKMGNESAQEAGHLKTATISDFEQLQEQYETEEKLANDLRKEFNRFAAKWL